jgi:hypothetical protein
MTNILEEDLITLRIIVPDKLYPIPIGAKIVENLGKEKFLVTDDAGALIDVIHGDCLHLEMKAIELFGWIGTNRFVFKNPDTNKLQLMRLNKVDES